MRLLLAGLLVFGGAFLPFMLLGEERLETMPSLLLWLIIGTTFLSLCFAALHLFNPIGLRPLDTIQTLEERGLLESTDYRATRAFQVEEWEDEGVHYFIELEDDSVLYLNGQYLYEYEPIEDDPELNQSRSFPCTEFTVQRHKVEGYVLDLLCRGEVIEPEITAPSFSREDYRWGIVPEDGEILRERGYDEIKRERMKGERQTDG